MSFHDSAGGVMNTTTTDADHHILLPVQNGNLADCRSQDVKFVRLQCTLDFADLARVAPPGNTLLSVNYYMELPQSSVVMQNGAGANYNLTTYHGVGDLRTLDVGQVETTI